ncbi:methionine adenosyltransferase 2 subunit beta-like isoform X2 [Mytilus galloprovincialis]
MSKKVLITGASGLLGRAVYKEFVNEGSWEVLGLAFSRCTGKLRKCDITKDEEVKTVMKEFNPSVVIHSAAERKPDAVEKKPEATQQLNVSATKVICQNAAAVGAWVLYISTDYVFEGSSPPYKEDAIPNPLNKYGQSKFEGEKVTMEVSRDNSILRVPILYGDIEYLDESAVTTLFQKVTDSSKPCPMSDYERRFPTHCDDIAYVIRQLAEKRIVNQRCELKMQDVDLENCMKLVDDLLSEKHQSYMWPFYQPVDPIALGLYDYFELVKKPMDLSTIKNNLECCLYKSVDEFSDDMRLLYQNCYLYSEPDTEIYKMAKQLEEYFVKTMETTKSDKPVGIDSSAENYSFLGKEMASTIDNLQLEDNSIKGVYHWSGDENMTKYDMALVMAEVFSLPSDHIQPDKKPSPGASRPFNSQLSCQRLKDLGIAKHSQFKSKILNVLKPYYKT